MADDKKPVLSPLEELLGDVLIVRSGNKAAEERLPLGSHLATKKQIILYFSAHWCPPCQQFTPLLSEAYDSFVKKTSSTSQVETEIVFVSRDSDAEAFAEYHGTTMSFPALPYDKDRSEKLMEKCNVDGIPTMIAIDTSGNIIQEDVDFRDLIQQHGMEAFPLTPERVLELKALQEAKTNETLEKLYNGEIIFAAKSVGDAASKPVSLQQLLQSFEHVGLLLGDGDFSDNGYDSARDAIQKVNSENNGNRCAIVYVAWSLYNEECDHSKIANKFHCSIDTLSDELREAACLLCGGSKGRVYAPHLVILRQGMGMCKVDGQCEALDAAVLVSSVPGLGRIREAGAASYPWDDTAMKAYQADRQEKVDLLKSELADMKFLTDAAGNKPVVVQKHGEEKHLEQRLFVGDTDAVVGLYFSAHWCGPCRNFTPKLIECYEQLKAAGKKFEVVFVSSDANQEEFDDYHKSMSTNSGHQFLALDYDQHDLRKNLSDIFDISGIPALILLRPDGTVIVDDGVRRISSVGAEGFPWDDTTVKRVKAENKAKLLQLEKANEEEQRAAGMPVVKRLIGNPTEVSHNVTGQSLAFRDFSTVGVPELFSNSGVIYYEIEIVEIGGLPQFGFSLKDGLEIGDEPSYDGVGDDTASWAVDGTRGCKWHNGHLAHDISWAVGNTIGLAANADKGTIAVSKDGSWTEEGFGVVFDDEAIKKGVYPCFTASGHKIRYCFVPSECKHAPPAEAVWNGIG